MNKSRTAKLYANRRRHIQEADLELWIQDPNAFNSLGAHKVLEPLISNLKLQNL